MADQGPPPLPPRSSVRPAIAQDAPAFESLFDAPTPSDQWLYQRDGQVHGPVSAKDLLELLYDGSIDFETAVAPESGDFKPARRYGVLRGHQDKVLLHRKQVQEAERRIREIQRRTRLRRLLYGLAASAMVAVGVYGVRVLIAEQRRVQAEEAAAEKEAELQAEMDRLLASVTIEPPLKALFQEPPSQPPQRRRARPRPRRASEASPRQGLSEAQIRHAVARVLPGFKRCIVQQIQRDPKSVGAQIVLSFSISNQGTPLGITLQDRFLRDSPLRGCLARQLASAPFPAYRGEVRNIDYPIRIGRT